MQRAHGSFGDHAAVPPPDTDSSTAYSYPPTPHDWARVQGIIHEYYVVQNIPLHTVRNLLRDKHGFKASERMIKARLSKWEYIKNAKREDWGYLAILHETRRKESKPTVFDIRGHRKTVKDLQRFIRNQNISPEKFLAESLENFHRKGQRLPDYIRAYTPDLDDLLYSPAADPEARSPSPSGLGRVASIPGLLKEEDTKRCLETDEFLHYRDPAKSGRNNFEHECPYKSYALASESGPSKISSSNMSTPQSSSQQSTDGMQPYSTEQMRRELEACSNQLLKPVPLVNAYGHNDMRCWSIISPRAPSEDSMEVDVCSRCDQPGDFHFPSLDLFEPRQGQRNILNDTAIPNLHLPSSTRDEGSWMWVSLCFLACMSLSRNDESVAEKVLQQAAIKFERLLRAQDPMILTAAGLVITMLHMHDQHKISTRIMDSANEVAARILPPGDPIRITILYLALSADGSGQRLTAAKFTSAQLKPVYERLKFKHAANHPAKHPYVVAAHYNYAWMLKWEGKLFEAEAHARAVRKESIECFGRLHMQTITAQSVIAGCLALQPGKVDKCIQKYRTMIRDASQILGIIHPFTLEAQRRLADKLSYVPGQTNIVLKLHRTILFGRATMLGRDHKFTIGQREEYERMLRRVDKWQDPQGRSTWERKEIEDLFTKDPEEAWELVSKVDGDICVTTIPKEQEVEEHPQDEEWCRLAMRESRSRSVSPASSNEYTAY